MTRGELIAKVRAYFVADRGDRSWYHIADFCLPLLAAERARADGLLAVAEWVDGKLHRQARLWYVVDHVRVCLSEDDGNTEVDGEGETFNEAARNALRALRERCQPKEPDHA